MNQHELDELSQAFPAISASPVYIYALIDPVDGDIRYIGKSIRPVARACNHMQDKTPCHRTHWLQSLKARGLKPDMVILERVEGAWPWQESERFWIAYGKRHGWRLTNNTDGGDGVEGLPADTRAKMAAIWLGRKHSAESKAKIGAASRGRKHSTESREHMRQIMTGRKITWVRSIAEANSKFTPEQEVAVRARLESGERVKDLAREFGVHRTTISKIKKGTYRG